MKKAFLVIGLFYFFETVCVAQLTAEQRIQDSVIGWWSNNYWDRNWKSPADAAGKIKETYVTKMVEWMKQSYTPVGGLGTVTRYIENGGYGVKFMVWNVSHDKQWTEPNGKFKPIPEENTKFYISANKIFGAYPVQFVNKDGRYFFTWQPDGYSPYGKTPDEDKRPAGIHPNAAKYITVRNEMQSVMLAPDNKLPFTTVSKGEFLQVADDALAAMLTTANDYEKKEIDRIRKNIAQLKEKYKSSLQQHALLKNMQPSKYAFDYSDPFELSQNDINWKRYYPLYKLTPDVLEKIKLPQPQWITISLPYQTKENGNQLHEMYTAVTQNINYDYIYNYFFNTEKIKGIAYTPANEAALNARLNAYRKKNKADNGAVLNTGSWPPDAFFFDDFSASNENNTPVNWYFRTSGNHSKVTTINNTSGKWLQLGYGNAVTPVLLKKPLPQNFALEFDVTTAAGFNTRTGGAVKLSLNSRPATATGSETESGNGTKIEITITSGNEADYNNNNYRGEIRVKINARPSVNEQNFSEGIYHTYVLKEFTNKKNTIRVAVKVKEGTVLIFVNNKLVATSASFKLLYGGDCKVCGIDAGAKFNGVYFTNTTDRFEETPVYISNIKFAKE